MNPTHSLDSQPRIGLATLPTPLVEAARLRAALGGPARCPRIFIKRDDLAGLARGGRRPYVIPIGGSSPIGALGYVAGTLELRDQLAASEIHADRLYYASGSRGTQAGLELGARVFGCGYRLQGVAVSAGEPEKQLRAARLINEAASLLETPIRVDASELVTDQRFIGDGYGIPSTECLEAIRVL